MEERCELTDEIKSYCAHCLNRPGSIDLNPAPGSGSQPSGYGAEVVKTVRAQGSDYGLVPSGGTAYTFGSGHGLHHWRDCSNGVDTPEDRVQELDDPNGDLWIAVMEPLSEAAGGRKIVNVDGGRITVACGVCALRPIVT